MAPLAMIANDAGYEVSGSDKTDGSPYLNLLHSRGIRDIDIGATDEGIAKAHAKNPIDWYVYSSAVEKEYPNHPEFEFCKANNIKMTKRDSFLNEILSQKRLKLFAVAGTHGKTTTTAMAVWLFKKLNLPISYSVGAKVPFAEMGAYEPNSSFFVYECDEFDRNFLAFSPYISLISGVSWDHHEIFLTQEDYNQAFRQFLNQSEWKVLWQEDFNRLNYTQDDKVVILDENDPQIQQIKLVGEYNRRDAWLVANAVHGITKEPLSKILTYLSIFPGISRRFEKIIENLYTDYAHTPEKITGALRVATESLQPNQKLVVVYEPLTNRRMHYMRDQHKDLFSSANALYWVPSFLAREDPAQEILSPAELIKSLNPQLQTIAKPMELNDDLKSAIDNHLKSGELVLCLSGGGGGSLDEWLRNEFKP